MPVGGLEPEWIMTFHSVGNFYDPNWRTHIFQRGWYTTNQSRSCWRRHENMMIEGEILRYRSFRRSQQYPTIPLWKHIFELGRYLNLWVLGLWARRWVAWWNPSLLFHWTSLGVLPLCKLPQRPTSWISLNAMAPVRRGQPPNILVMGQRHEVWVHVPPQTRVEIVCSSLLEDFPNCS